MNDFDDAMIEVAQAIEDEQQDTAARTAAGEELYAKLRELCESMTSRANAQKMYVKPFLNEDTLKILHIESEDTELVEMKVSGDMIEVRYLGEASASLLLPMDSVHQINMIAAKAAQHSKHGVPNKGELGGVVRLYE